jgi:hypothetical protein
LFLNKNISLNENIFIIYMTTRKRTKQSIRQTRRIIPPLKRGELGKFGYKILSSESERHIALQHALKEYGYASLIRKLNALAVLNKNRLPLLSKRLRRDMAYLKKHRETN